jgi:hypothetical protein
MSEEARKMRIPRRSPSIAVATIALLLSVSTLPGTRHAQAQAPGDDPYEQNDTPTEASTIPGVVELPDLTIYPADDPDYYRALMTPGDYQAKAIATPGLDLAL